MMSNDEPIPEQGGLLFVVGRVEQKVELELGAGAVMRREIPLCWMEGQVGALPVFSKSDDAVKASDGGRYAIYTVRTGSPLVAGPVEEGAKVKREQIRAAGIEPPNSGKSSPKGRRGRG